MKKTFRINKTKAQLERVSEHLDVASGSMYNALEVLYRMTDLGNDESDERDLISTLELIDITAIDSVRKQINKLIEEKEKRD